MGAPGMASMLEVEGASAPSRHDLLTSMVKETGPGRRVFTVTTKDILFAPANDRFTLAAMKRAAPALGKTPRLERA